MTNKEVVATTLVVFVYINNVWGHGNIFVKITFFKNLLGYGYENMTTLLITFIIGFRDISRHANI